MSDIPPHLYDEEREIELRSIERGVARYRELLSQQNLSQHPASMRLIRDAMSSLIPVIEEYQMNVLLGTVVKGVRRWGPVLVTLPADRLALITLISMINAAGTKRNSTARVAKVIGEAVDVERTFDKVKREARHVYRDVVRYTPQWGTEEARKLARKAGYEIPDDINIRFHVGGLLIHLAMQHTNLFKIYTERKKRKTANHIELRPECQEFISKRTDDFEILRPWYAPMVVPPKDWVGLKEGGYEWHKVHLVKQDYRRKSEITKLSQVGQMVDVVNHLQRVPYRINKRMLEIVEQAYDAGGQLGNMVEAFEQIPPEATDEILNDPVKKSRWLFDRKRVHEHNRNQIGKRVTLLSQMQVARDYSKYDRIWFVWQLDWRGRMYPLSTALHPQCDEIGKSLLEFAEGKELGEHGLYWLKVHLANCIGWDKEELKDKIRKVDEHEQEIKRWADDPFTHRGWSDCDSPYRALAAAIDYSNALRSGDHRRYKSFTPVAMDGTCNGLQHLSALGRDPVGAAATNLTDNAKPSDIYTDVAEEVMRMIQRDKHSDEELVRQAAEAWEPFVTRSTCKRGTMTTPYGVTKQGMRQQLLVDGMVDEVPGEINNNLNYMRDCLHESISKVVVAGRKIMDWLQECAQQCADEQKPCSWVTPLGFLVHQQYLVMRQRFVFTLLQKFGTWVPKDQRRILKSRQIRGIAPNYIHSLDACHMGMVILALRDQGINDISPVHDSFATHACNVGPMRDTIRKEFVKLHTPDLLEDFRQQQCVDLPEPPPKGDFDLSEVERSTNFVG